MLLCTLGVSTKNLSSGARPVYFPVSMTKAPVSFNFPSPFAKAFSVSSAGLRL